MSAAVKRWKELQTPFSDGKYSSLEGARSWGPVPFWEPFFFKNKKYPSQGLFKVKFAYIVPVNISFQLLVVFPSKKHGKTSERRIKKRSAAKQMQKMVDLQEKPVVKQQAE